VPIVSVSGLGNGVDFGRIVDQLVAIQRKQTVERLATTQQTRQSKLTDYGTLTTKLLALETAARALAQAAAFTQHTTSVSDPTVLAASATASATPGSSLVTVQQLATAHTITHTAAKAVASPTTSITTGGATFTFKVGLGPNETVTLAAGATLEDLKHAINNLGAGVLASIVNTGSESAPAYRLVLTARKTGANAAISIVTDSTDLDFLNTSGTGGTETIQAAQDAVVLLGDPTQNPVRLERSSNTITDAIPGVTLTLSKSSGGSPVTVTVSRDTAQVKATIKSLVNAYNDMVTFIRARTTYDPATKTGGLFVGEETARRVLDRLRSALTDPVSGLTTYTAVGQVGLQTQRDGTLTVNEAGLDQALSTNLAAVQDLFVGQSLTTGVAKRLVGAVDQLTDVAVGPLTLRKQALTKQVSDLATQISLKQAQVDRYADQLRRQFAALEAVLAQLQTQSNALGKLGGVNSTS
jgi:flagellar hook-associated protein 2